MYVIALYGILLMLVSLWMIAMPEAWVERATAYCRSPFMHPIEIVVCLGFGAPFVYFAGQSQYPSLFKVFGYTLVAVGAGLAVIPPSYHQRYGIWSLQKIGQYFRPLGVVSFAFGAFLVYVALGYDPPGA